LKRVVIERRFCGPPASANGGYFAGVVAGLAGRTVAVQLLQPPPLETELEATEEAPGVLELRHGDALIARTRPAHCSVPDISAPGYLEAIEASRRYVGFAHHPFPHCFVCGPRRVRGDGLRIFPGSVAGRRLVAAPWVADASLDAGDGKVRAEFMWAALDCPGYFGSIADGRMALLGELTAHVNRRVHIDERCTAVGWHIASAGRKHEAGTALFDEDAVLCAYARAIWVELRPALQPVTASPSPS
jgi:hypothetical protein